MASPASAGEFDRSDLVPSHTGDSVLPHTPFFTRLVRHACQTTRNNFAVRDVNLGIEKTYLELLTDVLAVRKAFWETLSPEVLEDIRRGKEVYIGLLAAGGYEFAVGFIAVIALGAAVVPMTIALPVKEASYFVLKSRAVAILTSNAGGNLGESLSEHVERTTGTRLPCIHIVSHFQKTPLAAHEIKVSADLFLNDNRAGVVIFTSGTTGPPKGAVMRRGYLHESADAIAYHYGMKEDDVILHILPVHHATGIGINFVPAIYVGACVEFRSGGFDAAWMWERWKRGGLNIFSAVPTIYIRMMRHFQQQLSTLPQHQVDQYVAGARQFRALLCGTSAFPAPVQEFWIKILGGKRILTRYGATEFGAVFKVPLTATEVDVPYGSVGTLGPGLSIKLSEGDEGELYVKGPALFSKYLFDKEATAKAHDSEGYFKTGDVVRREGDNYFILGRASLDIIKSGGYKLSALDIEREIMGLPYIAEVMVTGVADDEFGQRVGAAITLREDQNTYSCARNGHSGKPLTLADVRQDLRSSLAGYKMPTLLRIVEGELPKNATGKVMKKVLGPKYFPPNYHQDPEVQVWSNQMGSSTVKL